jgi:hypothetical protein
MLTNILCVNLENFEKSLKWNYGWFITECESTLTIVSSTSCKCKRKKLIQDMDLLFSSHTQNEQRIISPLEHLRPTLSIIYIVFCKSQTSFSRCKLHHYKLNMSIILILFKTMNINCHSKNVKFNIHLKLNDNSGSEVVDYHLGLQTYLTYLQFAFLLTILSWKKLFFSLLFIFFPFNGILQQKFTSLHHIFTSYHQLCFNIYIIKSKHKASKYVSILNTS